MNYIIFDLEWNQTYGGSALENPRMPFEIIEIGAIKLNSNFEIIDTYSSLVKPKLYKKLQPHIKSILTYDESVLFKNGRPFDMVCKEFLKWCGEDYMFGTWGAMDLYYLQSNMDFFYMKKFDFPLKYYNIQQIYAECMSNDNISKLEKAVDNLKIEIDRPFHSAVNDAYYTSLILQKIKVSDFEDKYSYDLYNLPYNKESEIYAKHKTYSEYITMTYNDRKDIIESKDFLNVRCCKCNKKAMRKIKWFANTPNSYLGVSRCIYHGLLLSKIKIKTSKEDNYYAIKTVSRINKSDFDIIKERQNELRIRRQIKRNANKKNKKPN